jgi:hypothetical protein
MIAALLSLALGFDDSKTITLGDFDRDLVVRCEAFSRTGERLAVGLSNSIVLILDVAKRSVLAKREVVKSARVAALGFGNKGEVLAVGLNGYDEMSPSSTHVVNNFALEDVHLYDLRELADGVQLDPRGRFPKDAGEYRIEVLSFNSADEKVVVFQRAIGGNFLFWEGREPRGPLAIRDLAAKQTKWLVTDRFLSRCTPCDRINGEDLVAVSEQLVPERLTEPIASRISLIDVRTGAQTLMGDVKGDVSALAFGDQSLFGVMIEYVAPKPRYRFCKWPVAGGGVRIEPLSQELGELTASRRCVAHYGRDGRVHLWTGAAGSQPRTANINSSTASLLCVSDEGQVALVEKGHKIVVVTPRRTIQCSERRHGDLG